MITRLTLMRFIPAAVLLAGLAAPTLAAEPACQHFAADSHFAGVLQACESFVTQLPDRALPAGKLDCSLYADNTRQRCEVFWAAGRAVMADPALAAPYDVYRKKAQLTAAWVESLPLRLAVMAFYAEHQRLPDTLAEVTVDQPALQHAREIRLGAAGEIVVVLPDSIAASAELRLLPVIAGASFSYRCRAKGVATDWLPLFCRQ